MDDNIAREVRELSAPHLNFEMGLCLGELDKLLIDAGLMDKARPILHRLFALCSEAGLRADALSLLE